MSAVRLARAFTGRNKIVKFVGCYHGHSDGLLVRAGSGASTLGIPDSPGVSPETAQHTLLADFNELQSVQALFNEHAQDIAAILVEPVAGNMGCILPQEGFLEGLRAMADEHGALLIFDEVMTGFRVAYGGAQELYGVRPDLTTLGKIVGGGLPVGAYGGRRDIMETVAPSGPMYQAGTLSGNPLAMGAGIETLTALKEPGVYKTLQERTTNLMEGILKEALKKDIPVITTDVGSMFTVFFTDKSIANYADVQACRKDRFVTYFNGMLAGGVYMAPSPFEAGFVSLAHSDADIEQTIQAFASVQL